MDHAIMNLGALIIALIFIFLPAFLAARVLSKKRELLLGEKAELLLQYYLVISVGVQGWVMGFVELFFPYLVAEFDNWPQSPFIFEVGAANLVFGILGILSIGIKGSWRAATAIGYGLFLLFSGINRFLNCLSECYWTIGTISMLWVELVLPLILFILVAILFCIRKKEDQDF